MDSYDRIAQRIDAINDLIWNKLKDVEKGRLMELEAEILREVSHDDA